MIRNCIILYLGVRSSVTFKLMDGCMNECFKPKVNENSTKFPLSSYFYLQFFSLKLKFFKVISSLACTAELRFLLPHGIILSLLLNQNNVYELMKRENKLPSFCHLSASTFNGSNTNHRFLSSILIVL
ncbi:hypothetical protein BLOT_013755 [Blomia tropicalis]|nr:hypothetical protein BLOT_013755 [Blomia tropicalis]